MRTSHLSLPCQEAAFFSGGAVVINRSADGGVLSQERMCEHFLPILKEKINYIYA